MPREIVYTPVPRVTGLTDLRRVIFSPAGEVWNGSAFVTYDPDDWADYLAALTEDPPGGYEYVADFPTAITASGEYTVEVYQGTGVITDALVGQGPILWNGLASVDQEEALRQANLSALGGAFAIPQPFIPTLPANPGELFPTRAYAATRNVRGTKDRITVYGYATVGDGGKADYLRVESEPTHDGWFQSNDGAYWELDPKQVLRPEMFGAVQGSVVNAEASAPTFTGLTDASTALQSFFDYLAAKPTPRADWRGVWGIASGLTLDLPPQREATLACGWLVATGAIDTMLTIDAQRATLEGELGAWGTGGLDYTTRGCRIGVYITNSRALNGCKLRGENFTAAGVRLNKATNSNNILLRAEDCRFVNCGSAYGQNNASALSVAFADRTDTGTCGSTQQRSIFGCASLPAAWEAGDLFVYQPTSWEIVHQITSVGRSTATAGGASTLTDSAATDWATNQWAGLTLVITGGTGSGQSRTIASNTSTVLTVSVAWMTVPDATSTYEIRTASGKVAVACYPWMEGVAASGTLGSMHGAGLDLKGNNTAGARIASIEGFRCGVLLRHNALYGATVGRLVCQVSGTAVVLSRAPTHANRGFRCLGYHAESTRFDVIGLSTAPYWAEIGGVSAMGTRSQRFVNGTVTSATGTTLTDNTRNWLVNQWVGHEVVITSGTGVRQVMRIKSNTATELSVDGTWAPSTPDNTSTYTIVAGHLLGQCFQLSPRVSSGGTVAGLSASYAAFRGLTILGDRGVYTERAGLAEGIAASSYTLSNAPSADALVLYADSATIYLKYYPEIGRVLGGRSVVRVSLIGTGTNSRPTGTLTFDIDPTDKVRGYTMMAGGSYAVSGMYRPTEFLCYLDHATKAWVILPDAPVQPLTGTATYNPPSLNVGSATYDPASLADGDGATTTVTLTGAALGDAVVASFDKDLQGILLTAWVSAADTVSVRFQNETGGAIDLASGTLKVRWADGAVATTTVTVTGAAVGDPARAGFSNALQGIEVTAWVSAADTVSVRFVNRTGGTLDLASGTLTAVVDKVLSGVVGAAPSGAGAALTDADSYGSEAEPDEVPELGEDGT